MRRPHPRYDVRRKAWVTKAGGRLKTLVSGPQNSETESLAWDAFYAHMAKLGQPMQAAAPTILLGDLANEFSQWMDREVSAGRLAAATKDYYVVNLQRFIDAVGGRRPASAILPIELERYKTGWHSVQTVRRLYNWGVKMGLLEKNQLADIACPESGARKRILSVVESTRLLRAADKHFRAFLLAQRHTIARPQEIRAVRWKQFLLHPVPHFVLEEFKGKRLRKKNLGPRLIPIDDRLLRLLIRLRRSRSCAPDDFIFLNRLGQPWTSNAVRCRMRRLRDAVGLAPDENGEKVVAYTLRHTGATRATARGVRDRALADVMGHASTATTARYQHLPVEELHAAIRRTNHRSTPARSGPVLCTGAAPNGESSADGRPVSGQMILVCEWHCTSDRWVKVSTVQQ